MCTIKGQIHSADCSGANATCSNPDPQSKCDSPQCVCPKGQVINDAMDACISGTECRKYNYARIEIRLINLHSRQRL